MQYDINKILEDIDALSLSNMFLRDSEKIDDLKRDIEFIFKKIEGI